MPSTSITDYQVLSAPTFTLDTANASLHEKELSLVIPDDLVFQGSARKPILAFKITTEQATNLHVWLNLPNFQIITPIDFENGLRIGWWKVVDFTDALSVAYNPLDVALTFKINQGKCRINDVVMWYQVAK